MYPFVKPCCHISQPSLQDMVPAHNVVSVACVGANQQYRSLLLDVLETKESVKKSDIMHTAHSRNMQLSDHEYTRYMVKVVRELCISSGSAWHLKKDWGSN